MRFLNLIFNGITYHKRLHLGLAAGVVIACAALTGALVMGDSVRHTLRGIAEARLGKVGHALDWGNRYFDAAMFEDNTALLALRGVAEPPPDRAEEADRINRAWVYGVDAGFWRFAPTDTTTVQPQPQEALINEETARRLALQEGDTLVLRLARPSTMPLEAPLARGGYGDTAVARVRVAAVLNDAQWGRFSLSTDQATPTNIFVDREWLSTLLDLPGMANVALAEEDSKGDELQRRLAQSWSPEQAGFRFRQHPSGIVQLESSRLFLEDAAVDAARHIGNGQPVLTYLVNSIAAGDRATPYSFVAAGVAPPDTPEGAVCINQWLADALAIEAGDTVHIAWYEPLPSGEFAERNVEAPVHRVLPMDAFQRERELALEFPGLSDVDTCRDWDIGMPLDEDKLQDKDNEDYWNAYGQTPKLLTTFDTGSAWWGTRFGAIMAMRFEDGDSAALSEAFRHALDPAAIGLAFMPVREEAQQAVDQAMDFGALFIGMSMFLIAAALTLLALLYAHGLQTRAGEMGTLLAVGWTPRRVRLWLLAETLPTVAAGVALGAPGGAGYARLLLYGLTRFWPDAVAGAHIRFHVAPPTLALGAAITACAVLAVMLVCIMRACRRPARELLQRDFASTPPLRTQYDLPYSILGASALPALAVSAYQAFFGSSDNPTVWFFASGASALIAALAIYGLLLHGLTHRPAPVQPWLWRLILTQLARRRSRSVGIAVVTGCGVFMVLSVASMQAAMQFEPEEHHSGAGGFTVFAQTTTAVRADTEQLLGFERNQVVPLRVWDGDDAGCLNLNRAQRPRLYGVNPQDLINREAFTYYGEAEALWSLLHLQLEDGVVPALVGDTDTALWGLQAATDPERGMEFEYLSDSGSAVRLRAVGRLPMRLSLFQGALLISEDNFTRHFPHEGGYRAFLINAYDAAETAAQLNRDYGRIGMEATSSLERLRAFYAVERAYLAMFLVLGGLGMMLGAGGAAIIVLRNLSERRAESALLVAVGYEHTVIRQMALIENAFLVTAGIIIGLASTALATLPLLLNVHTTMNLAAMLAVVLAVIVAYLFAVLATTLLFLTNIPLDALRTE